MKWKHRKRRVEENGFQIRWLKSRKWAKRNRKHSLYRSNFVHFQRRFRLDTKNWKESNKQLKSALERIPRMHSEYHRRKR